MKIKDITLQYPEILKNSKEIAEYISSLASDYVDEEMIEEYFNGTYAILKTVKVDSLKHGDKDHNIISKNKLNKYKKMSSKTIPPLVVENNIVMDGNHRLQVAKILGLNNIKIYDVIEK